MISPRAFRTGEMLSSMGKSVPSLRRRMRLGMRDVLAPGDAGQDLPLVLVQVGRDQGEDGCAHHLRRRVPEDPLGGGVPAQDGAIQLLAHDGLVRRLHNRGEPRRGQRDLVGGGYCRIRISQARPPESMGLQISRCYCSCFHSPERRDTTEIRYSLPRSSIRILTLMRIS